MKRLSKQTHEKAPAALPQPATDNQAQKQPTSEQIEKTLTALVNEEARQFNCDLEIARRVYRSNPQLVKSPRYPEPWRTLYTEELGEAPGDQDTQKALSIAQMRRKLRRLAREVATDLVNRDGATARLDGPGGVADANAGMDIAALLRRSALEEAQAILAGLSKHPVPMPILDALLLRDILLAYDEKGLLSAIEHLCGLPHSSSNKAA